MATLAPLLLLIFPAMPQANAKDKEQPIIRPPSPQPMIASAYVGEKTPLTLTLRGRIEDPAKIIIRKKPLFGQLGEPERLGRQTWRVWYSVAPDSGENLDSFSFAAKSVDSPVSAAANVQVSIIKREAQLVFPESFDFGDIPVGDTSIQDFPVQNSGGKTALITPALRDPWRLADTSPIRINAGETKNVRVAFSPVSPGAFAGKLVLEPNSKRGIRLSGSSADPLQWPSTPVLFASVQRNTTQSVLFKNPTDRVREVVFDWPDFLVAPTHVAIEPKSEMEIPLKLKAPPAFSWQGPVSFTCGDFKGSLAVAIETAPASITLEPATVLDLGEFPLGSSAKGALKLTNAGGRPARLTIDLPNGIKLNPSAAAMLVEPGTTIAFEVISTHSKAGSFDFSLPVRSDSQTFGAFRLKVSVRAAQPVEKLLAISAPESDYTSPSTSSVNIPPVEECALVESTPHNITISWKLTSPDTKGFLIERREIKQQADGQVKMVWKPWEGADIQISGDTATARFRKCPPGTFWNIRITGIDSKGHLGQQPTRSFRIETQPVGPLMPLWAWLALASAGAGLVFWFLKNKVRFVKNDLDAQIAKLGKQ